MTNISTIAASAAESLGSPSESFPILPDVAAGGGASSVEGWNIVQRPTGPVWAHETLPVWIVHYEAYENRFAVFKAYIATGKLIRGQHPCIGGVDNVSVSKDGFKTLEAAAQAAIAAAEAR